MRPHPQIPLFFFLPQILLLPSLFSVQAMDEGRNKGRKERKAEVGFGGVADTHSEWINKGALSSSPSLTSVHSGHLAVTQVCGLSLITLLWADICRLELLTSPWLVTGQHPSDNITVRPPSEDIPATDLEPNGSLISVSSLLKHPVTMIKDSSAPLPSHPWPLPAAITIRWPWLSFPLSLANHKPVT